MPKSSSPVRLEADLMQAAALNGERHHRSAAEQIEYWASIGRNVADAIDPDTLLAISSGLARLKVELVNGPSLDVDSVFESLERDREAGILQQSLRPTAAAATSEVHPRYQSSTEFPGYLEQVDANGNIVVGQFNGGEFIPLQHG